MSTQHQVPRGRGAHTRDLPAPRGPGLARWRRRTILAPEGRKLRLQSWAARKVRAMGNDLEIGCSSVMEALPHTGGG